MEHNWNYFNYLLINILQILSVVEKEKNMSMLTIESKTKKYSEIHSSLSHKITEMERQISDIRKVFMTDITADIKKLKTAGDALYEIIGQNKNLFNNPKTVIFHNIRVGIMKGKGKKEFDNDVTIKLIKKHLPLQQDTLIKIEEKVISKALEQLSASDLKKIAVEITDSQDEVMIKPVDSEIQKIINNILNESNNKEEIPIIILGK